MLSHTYRLHIAFLSLLAGSVASAQNLAPIDRGLLPGDVGVAPAINSQADLTIARGGSMYLAVWTDYRSRTNGSQVIQSDGDVYGVRLDSAGNPIDAVPFVIASGMGLQRRPKVAWNGENWLVIYESQDPTPPPVTYFDTYIRAVRVSAQGQALDAVPLALPPTLFEPSTIGLTISGVNGQWLVARCVYHDDGYGTYLAGQRIGANGQLIDATPIMLNDWVYGELQVFAQNGDYLAVGPDWSDSSIRKARRIGANLQPLAPSFNLPVGTLGVGTNGSEMYATWISNFTDLVGSRVTGTGTLINPQGTMLFPNFSGEVDIAHDGSNWWIGRTISNIASLIRLDVNGARLDPIGGTPLPIDVSGSVNSLYDSHLEPRAGGGVMYSWTDLRQANGNDQNGFVLSVTAGNTPEAERCITTSSANQRNSDLAIGLNGTVAVAYVSEHANNARVMVQLLGSNGLPTSAGPIELAQAPVIGTCGIAWNGSHFLVTWDQGNSGLTPISVRARRLNPDGSPSGTEFTVMSGMAPSVEALNGNFCIAATRYATSPQFIGLWANRVDGTSGTLLDGTTGVYLGGNYVNGLTRTRTDGSRWLVGAHSQWTHNSSQGDAIIAYVPEAGTPTQAFNPTPFSGASGDLDVAFSGTRYLLVWRNNSLSNANNYIAGRIMNTDGTYGPMFTIAEADGRQLRPTASWDGATFVVAWDDQRNQDAFYDARTDVYAVRVTEVGAVAGTPALLTQVGPTCTPALVSANGRTIVSTTRGTHTLALDSYRVGIATMGDPSCPADLDDGTGTGTPDGAVEISDLLYFLGAFESGAIVADLDNGTNTGTPDGGVDINDLLFFLVRFEGGC